MTTSNSTDLAATMEANSPAAPAPGSKSVADYVNDNVDQFERAIGDTAGAELLARTLLTELRRTPKLAGCTVQSFLGAAMQCAQINLMPGAALGHCWLVPMNNRRNIGGQWQTVPECEWWLGYQGMIELGYRSGMVASFAADDVRPKDEFRTARGTQGGLHHSIDYQCTDRGATFAYYAHASLTTGGDVWVVLRPEEVEALRGRSPAAQAGKGSPWDTDYRAMALKTCVRQLFKWLPTSTVVAPALEADGSTTNWDPGRPHVPPQVIDVDATDLYPDPDPDGDDGGDS